MKTIAPLLLVSCLPLLSQNQDPTRPNLTDEEAGRLVDDQRNNARFWEARIGQNHFMVALNRIGSVARHEYIISNAATRVVELTIHSASNSVARFYYVEPAGAQAPVAGRVVKRGQELLDRAGRRAGQDLSTQVSKEYPTTTHTGMLEFRVSSEAAVDQLHQSVMRAWKDGRGRVATAR